jgi:sodium-dependent dicarboxylate transporter 2/3/5
MNANIITDSLQANEYSSDWSIRFRRVGYQRMLVLRSQVNLYYFWEKRWFFLAMAIGIALLSLDGPSDLSREGYIVLVMSIVATILFITEPIPLPTVALLIIVAQVLLLDLDSTKVAKTLMTDSVLFIMGSLMLAVAVVKQQLDKRIAWYIVQMTGTKTISICFGITVVSGILASFVGEHTVAAMMLPVGITLITLTSDNPKKVRNLAAVLLFSICYGCSVAGIGTPSGGARNAIMVGYWKEFFYDPTSPETRAYLMDYWKWMTYAYPLFLAQLPFVTLILFITFKPEYKDLSRGVAKLRTQILMQGPLRPSDWLSIVFFMLILSGWITVSSEWGMGTVAVLGAAAFLIAGLVRWEEINSGVNWGVVLLYAAAISLGVEMKVTGAAEWIAQTFLALLAPLGIDSGVGLWAAVSVLTTSVTNTMSNGAAVAVLGPIVLKVAVVAGENPIVVGFITAVSSAFAYLTVVGTPACTIVYASGYLKTTDFLKVGWRMAIVSTVLLLIFASLYWPLLEG